VEHHVSNLTELVNEDTGYDESAWCDSAYFWSPPHRARFKEGALGPTSQIKTGGKMAKSKIKIAEDKRPIKGIYENGGLWEERFGPPTINANGTQVPGKSLGILYTAGKWEVGKGGVTAIQRYIEDGVRYAIWMGDWITARVSDKCVKYVWYGAPPKK
jgi:hypothetical protein